MAFDLRIDDLVRAVGISGFSRVRAFLGRPIEGEWPYLSLGATYPKIREGGRIVAMATRRDWRCPERRDFLPKSLGRADFWGQRTSRAGPHPCQPARMWRERISG